MRTEITTLLALLLAAGVLSFGRPDVGKPQFLANGTPAATEFSRDDPILGSVPVEQPVAVPVANVSFRIGAEAKDAHQLVDLAMRRALEEDEA